jgi:hypothetical protein
MGDYDFEDNDYDFEEADNLRSEVKAFERAGQSGKLAELLSSTVSGKDKKGGREAISLEDRFLINVDSISRKLNSEEITNLTENDINIMLEKSQFILGLKYKNPTAYILGYIASKGGTNLDPVNVKFVINKILPKIDKDAGIEPPDVVRYARYWKLYL